MKKLFFALLSGSLTLSGFSQSIPTQLTSIQTDYLKKSKHQKTATLILLSGGGALMITGYIIPKGEVIHESPIGQKSYKNDGIRGALTSSGAIVMLGSIPLFIASSKNKRKGMSLSFKNEMVPRVQNRSFVYYAIPSLSLKIRL